MFKRLSGRLRSVTGGIRGGEPGGDTSMYRSLVESSLAGVYLIQDGRFPYCNPRMAEIFGYESNHVLMRECTVADLVAPDDRDLVLGNIRKRLDAQVESLHYGFRGLRKDGRIIEVEVLGTRVEYRGRPAVIGTLLDVTESRRVAHERRILTDALANTVEAVLVLDAERRIISVNKAFTRITGYPGPDVLGHTPEFLRSGRHHETFYEEILQTVADRGHWQGELWSRRRSGEVFPCLASISQVREEPGDAPHYVLVLNDISSHKQIEERLDFLAHYDPLTRLPNRTLFLERFREALSRVRRRGLKLALLLMDLDAFKQVNESLGHSAGDELLRDAAARLRVAMGEDTTVARIGGDEFAVLLDDLDTMEEVTLAAGGLLEAFEEPFQARERNLAATASIGIALFPEDGENFEALLQQADAALYEAKAKGRNIYQFASGEMNAHALESITLSGQMRGALQRGEFFVEYQPFVRLADGRLTGAEALVRWQHPELGVLSPDRFIHIAEQSGQIAALGHWVLEEACAQGARWQAAGWKDFRIAVNLSVRQLAQPAWVEQVRRVLRDSRLAPERLKLEITESLMMSDPEQVARVLEDISRDGVKIAVDDFGVGYSSLSYLKRLPLDYLKIDRSFISDLPDDTNDAAITRAIIAVSRSLGIGQIGEGIETPEQLHFLREAGCEEGQGNLFSEPVCPERLAKLYDSGLKDVI